MNKIRGIKIFGDKMFVFLIVIGLIIRLIVANLPGFKIDVDAWFAWAVRLSSGGFFNFYSTEIWTNYTPGYLYILWFLGLIKELFSINSEFFYFILKIPAIICDLILSILIYKIILKKNSVITARLAAAAILFNPALIFDSAVWGQIDSVLTLFLVASIYFLNEKKLQKSSISFALALLIKPQAIMLLPVFLFFIMKNFSYKNLFNLSFPGFIILFVLSIPFFGLQVFQKLPELFLQMSGDYPYNSLFAYNFWGSIGFWVKDSTNLLFFSYQYWGYILFFIFWIFIGFWHFYKKNLSLFAMASLAALFFYFLPTRVHDRYLYSAIPFLIIVAFQNKSSILLFLINFLSLSFLLNLYYVYIYYNYFYLKLPSDIYSKVIYNFLDVYSKQLSILSTFIFILVSILILKLNHAKKTS